MTALEKAFLKRCNAIVRETKKLSFEQIKEQLEAIEQEFAIDRKDKNLRLALELQRRVKEDIFRAAINKQVPFEILRSCYRTMRSCGFTDLIQEYSLIIIYAKECRERGNVKEFTMVLSDQKRNLIREHNEIIKFIHYFIEQICNS